MIRLCSCSFDIIVQYGYVKIIIYIVTLVKIFCKSAIVLSVFDIVAIFG